MRSIGRIPDIYLVFGMTATACAVHRLGDLSIEHEYLTSGIFDCLRCTVVIVRTACISLAMDMRTEIEWIVRMLDAHLGEHLAASGNCLGFKRFHRV